MPVNNFDIETSSLDDVKIKEFLRDDPIDFTESIRKLQERKKYDEVWEKIKKKNNW